MRIVRLSQENQPVPQDLGRPTSNLDAEYFSAVENGDAAKLSRLIRSAASSAGYTIGPVWHGSRDARFLSSTGVFQSNREQCHMPIRNDFAFFFTDDYRTAKTYALWQRAFDHQNADPKTFSVFLKMTHPLEVDGKRKKWKGETEHHIDTAFSAGHDGYIVHDTSDEYHPTGKRLCTVYAVFDSSQIKLNGVTRNEKGEVIPLSQRFDPSKKDVRY